MFHWYWYVYFNSMFGTSNDINKYIISVEGLLNKDAINKMQKVLKNTLGEFSFRKVKYESYKLMLLDFSIFRSLYELIKNI